MAIHRRQRDAYGFDSDGLFQTFVRAPRASFERLAACRAGRPRIGLCEFHRATPKARSAITRVAA
jgi:hypothetical protein